MTDNSEQDARKARAERLRKQIKAVISGKEDAVPKDRVPSPREFIERRMREEEQKKRESAAE